MAATYSHIVQKKELWTDYGVSYVVKKKSQHLGNLGAGWSSVQFSHSVVSDSLWLQGLQLARPPSSSLTPRVYSNSNIYIKHYKDNLFLKWS